MKTTRKYPALGILFKEAMVQAIQAGHKTQTRRIMKYQPVEVDEYEGTALLYDSDADDRKEYLIGDRPFKPKYNIGDILYIQETWRIVHVNHRRPTASFYTVQFKDFSVFDYKDVASIQDYLKTRFVLADEGSIGDAYGKWRSSRFCPYIAARLFLRVTDVRVERLNDISSDDAIAEGIEQKNDHWIDYHDKDRLTVFMDTSNVRFPGESTFWPAEVASYRTLWETINGAKSWLDNPYVWVYTFERTEKPANQ